jgi:CelD/BcsL family acetyltransferase involved in cellulose biosynthesis
MIELEIIRDVGTFERLRDEWTELLSDSTSDCVFLTWEWQFTWWRHLGGTRQLSILAVRSGGRLIGLAPLGLAGVSLARILPLRTLEFLGSGQVGSDYLDVIVRCGHEHDVLTAMTEYLDHRNLVVALTQLESRKGAAWRLGRQLSGRGWTAARAVTSVCPFIDLRGLAWPAYLERRSASHRYNFRRKLRGLERQGAVAFAPATTDETRHESLARLIATHLRRWDTRGGSDGFNRPELIAFHEEFSRLALTRGWLRLFTLRVGPAPVADLYCLRYGGAMLFYQSGFDEQWTKQSVGLVAMGLAIKAAIEDGAVEYDLLHGDEDYKFLWTDETRELARLELYPAHLLGSLCRRTVELKRALRRVLRNFKSGVPIDDVASAP